MKTTAPRIYQKFLASRAINFHSLRSACILGPILIASGCSTATAPSTTPMPEAGQWVQVYKGGTNAFAVIGSNLFAGTDSGVFVTADNGTTWTADTTGMGRLYVVALGVSGTNLFAATTSGLFLSTNYGSSWKLSSGDYCPILVMNGTELITSDANGDVLVSTNGGATWYTDPVDPYGNPVRAIAVGNSGLVAGSYEGVFVFGVNGWTATSMTHSITAFAVNGNTLYAGTQWYDIFRSTDGGITWADASGGLTWGFYVHTIVPSGTNLFAALDGAGIFLSTDEGSNWSAVNTGLPQVNEYNVTALGVSGANLFAGVADSGIWRSPLSELIK